MKRKGRAQNYFPQIDSEAKTEPDLHAVNELFNTQLQKQIDGTLSKGHVYHLGNPSEALLSNLNNIPIEMPATTLETKSRSDYKSEHPFDLEDVENLPQALHKPIAVFESETNSYRTVVLTELLDKKGKHFIVVLGLIKMKGRNVNTINSIISLYPKSSNVHIGKWFLGSGVSDVGRDLLKWVDVKKALRWLTDNASYVHSIGLSTKSIAKIIKNFENPKFTDKKTT